MQALFKSLWIIPAGRALIYTVGNDGGRVDVKVAGLAWIEMMNELATPGKTVAQAVAAANAFIAANYYAVSDPRHFEFVFDGGGDVKLVP